MPVKNSQLCNLILKNGIVVWIRAFKLKQKPTQKKKSLRVFTSVGTFFIKPPLFFEKQTVNKKYLCNI